MDLHKVLYVVHEINKIKIFQLKDKKKMCEKKKGIPTEKKKNIKRLLSYKTLL